MWDAGQMESVRPRVAITGASAGIGAAFAHRLAVDGYDLVLIGRDLARLQAVAEDAARNGAKSQIIVADLATSTGVDQMLDELDLNALSHGALPMVILNAGVTLAAKVGQTAPAEADRVVTLLATGVMRAAERVVPAMVAAGGGQVIIVSSIAAFTPMKKSAIYAASKAFSTSYARSVDLEVRSSGVRVLAVCPGYVRTGLHEKAGLGHLRRSVPRFMWLEAEQVVEESLKALRRGRSVLVPGVVYRITRPFLNLRFLQRLWGRLTKRSRN